jgi:uncharacterized repeat protein (TIGR03803 family)
LGSLLKWAELSFDIFSGRDRMFTSSRKAIMTNPAQHRSRISGILRAAGAGLVLGVVLVSAVVATQPAQAQTLTVLYTFTGGTDGGGPEAGLIRDASGNLYGTTTFGGDPDADVGVVYRVDSAGRETVLHTFTGGSDGASSFAGLIRDAEGNLYGTTGYGGAAGAGTVFKLAANDKHTVLHSFTGKLGDGALPFAGLVCDAAGNLYGTTQFGGPLHNGRYFGTVFKLSEAGKETILYSFKGGADGGYPTADLVRDKADNLYGTTSGAYGTNNGSVFKVNAKGEETVLYRFTGGADGANPRAGLVRDVEGNLYGTTQYGGDLACYAPYGCGTVFRVDPKGRETVLYSFTGNGIDGQLPLGGLVRDADGNLYGTTYIGGTGGCFDGTSYGCGTVFKLDKTGTETVLYSFTAGTDGAYPVAGRLVRDAAGNLYGANHGGGTHGQGVLFKLAP